jgi:hypothetical protein
MINENITDFAYLNSPFFSSSASFFSKASLCSCFNFIIYYFASQEMINIKAWFGMIFALYFIENLNQVTIKMIIILIELGKMKKMRILN